MYYVQILACLMWIAVQTGSPFGSLHPCSVRAYIFIGPKRALKGMGPKRALKGMGPKIILNDIILMYNILCYVKYLFSVMWGIHSVLCELLILCYVKDSYCAMWIAVQTGLPFGSLHLCSVRAYNFIGPKRALKGMVPKRAQLNPHDTGTIEPKWCEQH